MSTLESEKVVVSAPMSFHGSAARIWKLTTLGAGWVKAIIMPTALILVLVAWMAVACWYVVFGLFLAPYRIVRRGQRKRNRDDLRHREMLEAVRQNRAA